MTLLNPRSWFQNKKLKELEEEVRKLKLQEQVNKEQAIYLEQLKQKQTLHHQTILESSPTAKQLSLREAWPSGCGECKG